MTQQESPGILRRFAGFFGRSWVLACIVVIAVGAWMGTGMLAPSPANGNEAAGGETAGPTVPQVRVATFLSQKVADGLRLQGRTEADRHVTVKAETSGTLEEILVERGATVEAGQVIARLDVDDRQAQVDSAKALRKQRVAEFDAAQKLNEKGYRGAVDLSQARAGLDAAEAQVELAEIELDRTILAAPFAGVMYERDVELGDFVDRGDPVAHIVDLSVISAVGQVSERNLGRIALGQPATVRTLGGMAVNGIVSYVGTVADVTTRTFPIEVDVANADRRLIEGVTVEIIVPLAELTAHSITPAILTLADDGAVGVRAVDDSHHVVFYPVTILRDSVGAVLVSGLPDEVRLITVGQEFVHDGQLVEPVSEETVTGVAEASS